MSPLSVVLSGTCRLGSDPAGGRGCDCGRPEKQRRKPPRKISGRGKDRRRMLPWLRVGRGPAPIHPIGNRVRRTRDRQGRSRRQARPTSKSPRGLRGHRQRQQRPRRPTGPTPRGTAAWRPTNRGCPIGERQPYPNTAEKQALPPSWSDRGPETGYAAQQTAPRRDLGRPQTAADSTSAAFYDDRAPAGNTNRVSYNDYQNKDYPPSSSDAAGQRRYGSSYDTAPPASYSYPSRSSYAANPDTTGDYRAANGYPPNRDLPADNRTAARPPSSYDLQYGNRSSYPANDASTGPALPSPAPAYSAPSSTAYPPRDDRAAPAWSGSGAYAP